MAGAATVRADSPHANAFREVLAVESKETAPLYIGDGEVLLSNLKGYAQRMKQVNANGEQLAKFLAEHQSVETVWHPSIGNTANYDAVKTKDGGYGGLLSFVLKAPKRTPKVYDTLKLSKGPSFGTLFTLVCPYTLLAHYHELEWTEGCGVPSNLLRVSVGIEPFETIRAAFEEALANG
jgi:cystathionine gamma-synthase